MQECAGQPDNAAPWPDDATPRPDSVAPRRPTNEKARKALVGPGGRFLMLGALLYAFFGLRRSTTPPRGSRGHLGILRPPGSLAEPAFLARCIRCTRCADACEAQCILFFGPEAGPLEGTPYIQARDKGCTLCLTCIETCPTGALQPRERMEDVRMGVAEVDKRLCVSLNGTGVCGACHTVCPLRNRAITLSLRNAPVIQADHCVGCGLCEEICIVREPRAIQVRTERAWPGSEIVEGT